jgi:hypothetical protein
VAEATVGVDPSPRAIPGVEKSAPVIRRLLEKKASGVISEAFGADGPTVDLKLPIRMQTGEEHIDAKKSKTSNQ